MVLHKRLVFAVFIIFIPAHLLINENEDNKRKDDFIQCDKGWFLFGGKCYRIFGIHAGRLNWQDASKTCKGHGGHLATVQSKEVQEFIFTFLLLQADISAWIGLNDIDRETHYVWDDELEYSYSNWNLNEPSELIDYQEDCVEMKFVVSVGEPGEWNDRRCSDGLPYICQVDEGKQRIRSRNPTLCLSEKGTRWKFEDSCYNIVKEEMTWEDAEKYCQVNYDGHLVKVLNFNVNYFLKYIMSNLNTDIWIGIKIKEKSQQQFSSGWYINYAYWRGTPENFTDGTCVIRTKDKLWEVVSCTKKYHFICETSSVSPPVLKKPSEVSKCPDEQEDWRDLGGEYCYFIDTMNMFNFYRANFECIRRGASLVSIHSKEEVDALAPFVRHGHSPVQNFNWRYFIGLYRSPANESVLVWADGSPTDYTYWNGGEPNNVAKNEKCVEMWFIDVKWNDVKCSDDNKGYICSVRKIPVNVTKTEVDCDCISDTTFGIFIGMTAVSLLLVVSLMPLVFRAFRSWKMERRKRYVATDVPLQTLHSSTLQHGHMSSCEQCRNRIIENDNHIYEYVGSNARYEEVESNLVHQEER